MLRSETGPFSGRPCPRAPVFMTARSSGDVPGVVVGRGRTRSACAFGAAPAEGPDRSRRVSSPSAPTSSRPSRSMAAPAHRVRSSGLPRVVARRFVEGPEVVVTPPAHSPTTPPGSRSGRGLTTRRRRGLEGMAVRDPTELVERWSANSQVDRTATPAHTPPCTSPTHRGQKIFDLPRPPLTRSGRVLRPGDRTGMRAARPPDPLGGSHRSAVRVNVAVQERRLRRSAERSKPATIRSRCRTDL